MKKTLLWDPRFPERKPARLTLPDDVASACARAGIATAADPAEAGALAAGIALSPGNLIEVELQHGPVLDRVWRVFLPATVAAIVVAAGTGAYVSGAAGPMVPTYLPTVASAPILALGAKRLVAGYSGNLYTLTRASDGATLDVACATGSDFPDYAAIAGWIGGSSATVTTWWDQSGNGKHFTLRATFAGPSFDATQALAGCVPLLWDGQRTTVGGPVVKILANTTLSVSRQNFTIVDIVQPQTSLQDHIFWSFTDAAFTNSVNYASLFNLTTSPGLTMRPGVAGTNVFGHAATAPRNNPSVIVSTMRPTGREILIREALTTETVNNVPTVQTMPTLMLGASPGDQTTAAVYTFASRLRRWGFVLYPALSTGDQVIVRDAMIAQFSIPTSFTSRVVFDGDSIMEGSGVGLLKHIPAQVGLGSSVERFNIAIHGQNLGSGARGNRTTRRDPLYTAAYGAGKCISIIEAGTNDLAAGTTGASVYSDATLYVQSANTVGFSTLIQTILPSTGASYTSGVNTQISNYNTSVRANSIGATGILDAAADATMGAPTAPDDTSLYLDKLHPTAAGDLITATNVYKPALAALGVS